MTAMNVVHMRVKPGMEADFLREQGAVEQSAMPGSRSFRVAKVGERDFVVVGEWDSMEALVAARPQMIGYLDRVRPLLEDLGGGRGITEPWSGEVKISVGG
jgi:hypothetical protein